MMKRLFFISSIFLILFSSITKAQSVEFNLEGLTDEQKAQLVLQAEKMKKENGPFSKIVEPSNLSPEKLNEWVTLGKNVGLALTAVAKELGVASDEFLKSNTGKITMVLIVWKVMGKDILDVIGGTIAWIILTSIIIWSFKFFHMKKRVKQPDKKVEYISRYTFQTRDARVTSAFVHVAAFFLVTLICMVIVF